MNFFSDVWTAIKAFASNPIKYIYDPGNVVLEYQIEQAAASGKTVDEIKARLTSAGFKEGSPIIESATAVYKFLRFWVDHPQLIIILVAIYFAWPFLTRVRAKVKA